MNRSSSAHRAKRVTVRQIQTELQRLRQRVEDLEDLRDLNAAIARNGGKTGIPWSKVRKDLEI